MADLFMGRRLLRSNGYGLPEDLGNGPAALHNVGFVSRRWRFHLAAAMPQGMVWRCVFDGFAILVREGSVNAKGPGDEIHGELAS
jgi:hypothetical protein